MNIGLAIDKKNGVESKIIGSGKSGDSKTHTRTMNSETKSGKSVFGGEYEIKKALNKWDGWGTCLKPSYEPIIVARKPFKGTLVDNIEKYGVGGINIDECRIESDEKLESGRNGRNNKSTFQSSETNDSKREYQNEGRFPANTILTYDENDYEEVCGGFPNSKGASSQNNYSNGHIYRGQSLQESQTSLSGFREWYNDNGSASRYFYCAKASKKDRDEGLDDFVERTAGERTNRKDGSAEITAYAGATGKAKNIHPCVKPTSLMQYLVRLVTPKGGTILDPFNGSGSTGKAVMYENKERDVNYKYIGIELNEEYLKISEARIKFVNNCSRKDD